MLFSEGDCGASKLVFKEQSEIRDVQRLMNCFKGTVECSISKIARKVDQEKLLENRVGLEI